MVAHYKRDEKSCLHACGGCKSVRGQANRQGAKTLRINGENRKNRGFRDEKVVCCIGSSGYVIIFMA